MASRVASKIKMATVDELLGVPEISGTQDIDIRRISAFKNHPFKVLDDDKMTDLIESIRENGILNPVIVRPNEAGNYEMISGHRRLHAAGIAGLDKIPAIVKEMTDDEATIVMVDANIQREELLPSEKAFAFKMKMEAMKHQGLRSDITLSQNGTKSRADEELASQLGTSRMQIHRYVRLTDLIEPLLDMVDCKKLGLTIAVDISFFDNQVQQWIYEYVTENGFLKPVQIAALKDQPNLSNTSQYNVISILNGALPKKKENAKVSLSERKLDKYFPPHYSAKQREEVIISLLEQWHKSQEQ